MKLSANASCPCGSNKKYKKCCKIYHDGTLAKSAEILMRSRYSAFSANKADYIIKTTHPSNSDFSNNKEQWRESILSFSKNTEFRALDVLEFIDGDTEAYVTFKAVLFQDSKDISFIEKSKFLKVDSKWLYHSGEFLDG